MKQFQEGNISLEESAVAM